ncbi:MAG: holo-ACP synthase [Candidatus Aminicenantes bacterium]|nr:holo-ACP synthase [Candidatus Aminicenantes bacterium]
MVVGIGLDIVEVERIAKALRGSKSITERVFTPEEIRYCSQRKNKYQHFAGRFAAKEAALKALGTGWQAGIRWRDVETTAGPMGEPQLTLYGKAAAIFKESKARSSLLTITHATDYAVACVVIDG